MYVSCHRGEPKKAMSAQCVCVRTRRALSDGRLGPLQLISKSGSHSRGLRLPNEWTQITPTNGKSLTTQQISLHLCRPHNRFLLHRLSHINVASSLLRLVHGSSFVLKEHLQEMTDVREHGPQSPSWQSFSQVWMKSVIKRDRVGSDNCTD